MSNATTLTWSSLKTPPLKHYYLTSGKFGDWTLHMEHRDWLGSNGSQTDTLPRWPLLVGTQSVFGTGSSGSFSNAASTLW